MSFVDLILMPIAFGLIGFLEPCSVAGNLALLSYVDKAPDGRGQVAEAIKFTMARSLFLGLVGSGVGLMGARVLALQAAYSIGVGILFIVLGLFPLVGPRFGWQLPALDLSRWLRYGRGKPWAIGILFGLSAPTGVARTPVREMNDSNAWELADTSMASKGTPLDERYSFAMRHEAHVGV